VKKEVKGGTNNLPVRKHPGYFKKRKEREKNFGPGRRWRQDYFHFPVGGNIPPQVIKKTRRKGK